MIMRFKYQTVSLVDDLSKELPMALCEIIQLISSFAVKNLLIDLHFKTRFLSSSGNNINQSILNIALADVKKGLKFLKEHSVQHYV